MPLLSYKENCLHTKTIFLTKQKSTGLLYGSYRKASPFGGIFTQLQPLPDFPVFNIFICIYGNDKNMAEKLNWTCVSRACPMSMTMSMSVSQSVTQRVSFFVLAPGHPPSHLSSSNMSVLFYGPAAWRSPPHPMKWVTKHFDFIDAGWADDDDGTRNSKTLSSHLTLNASLLLWYDACPKRGA